MTAHDPKRLCVWCERPFATEDLYERNHPDSCDSRPDCWCRAWCWSNDGSTCEASSDEAKEQLVSELRQRVCDLELDVEGWKRTAHAAEDRLNVREMDLEEHKEILGELSQKIVDDADGFRKDIAAHREVLVMRDRGFQFRWDTAAGHDWWEKPGEANVPAHGLCRIVLMQVADEVDRARKAAASG